MKAGMAETGRAKGPGIEPGVDMKPFLKEDKDYVDEKHSHAIYWLAIIPSQ